MKKIFILLMTSGMLACSGGKTPNVELIQDMMDLESVKAQEYDESAPQHRGMRLPPDHTVPVGFKPYLFANDPEAGKKNINPLAGDFSSEVLVTGQKYYGIQCALCHGDQAKGEGLVGAKMMLKPPPLVSDKLKTWTDGEIYHLLVMGRGLMGSHANHIPKEEWRWAVVNYIRHLQKESK
jgi:mono/diheme cytochrome c family protein